MKVSEIIKSYKKLKIFVESLSPQPNLTEYDLFIDSLKRFEKLEVSDLSNLIQNISLNTDTMITNTNSNEVELFEHIMQKLGVTDINFNTVQLSMVEELEVSDLLSKKQLLMITKKIGITKSVFKTKKEIYQEINRTIMNRDILTNVENNIKKNYD